jgi:tetratricopeptide (TPR) repeat protein
MKTNRVTALIGVTLLLFTSNPPMTMAVEANGLPYDTYTYSSSRQQVVKTQDAYIPLSLTYDLGGYTLSSPQDIVIDAANQLYIADTGNSRVIVYDMENNEARLIGENLLDQPTGVAVDAQGRVYVADFGTKASYQFTEQENAAYTLTTTYEKPLNTPFFSEEDPYDPVKITVDKGQNVYVLLAGNINGLGQYKNNGEFFGFFGGNRIPNTIENTIRSILFDEQQRRDWFQMVPKPVYNVSVDEAGLILTTTKAEDGYLKLNIANVVYNQADWGFPSVEDLAVGPYNNVFTITSDGYIVEYDPSGNVLFIFSGPDVLGQKGLFKAPTGIAIDNANHLYVVDKTTNALQIFVPTYFADLVHEAIDLYFDGQYALALEPWQEVLRMNRLFDLANQGLGDAYFALGNYEAALDYYRIARDQEGYSNAYWEVRNDFLLSAGSVLVWGLLFLVLFTIVNSFVPLLSWTRGIQVQVHQSLQEFRLYRELLFPFYVLKNPSDGFYGIKREKKMSNLSATIYLFVFFAVYLIWLYETNFLFNDQLPSDINIVEQAITLFVPFFFWVVANFLVSSVRDGEGTLSNVYQASSAIFLPLIIVLPILTFVSQALTYNESFIYEIGLNLVLAATAIYFVLMVKEIHFYEGKDTLTNIVISLFTALMMAAILFIVYFLLGEVWQLGLDIIQEVTANG